MTESEIDRAARSWHADAVAPPSLRPRIDAVLSRRFRWRTTAVAGLAVALAVAALVFVLPARRLPAADDIERELDRVRTARWRESTVSSDASGKITQRIETENRVRLDPDAPAQWIQYRDATLSRPGIAITTPKAITEFLPDRGVWLISRGVGRAALRGAIRDAILAPRSRVPANASGSSYRWTPWKAEPATIDDGFGVTRRVVRLSSECRLNREFYSRTLWADPATRRLVRTESVGSWGVQKIVTRADRFAFDIALPADQFRPTVPGDARVFAGDSHSDPPRTIPLGAADRIALRRLLARLDDGWRRRDARVFLENFDLEYLPRLINPQTRPDPIRTARAQRDYWERHLRAAGRARRFWDTWRSTARPDAVETPGIRIVGVPVFYRPAADPPILEVRVAVRCESRLGPTPVRGGSTGYTLWLRRAVGGGFKIVYAEIDDLLFTANGRPFPRLFDRR